MSGYSIEDVAAGYWYIYLLLISRAFNGAASGSWSWLLELYLTNYIVVENRLVWGFMELTASANVFLI